MQVNNSSVAFGSTSYKFNCRTDKPEITTNVKNLCDGLGTISDLSVKLTGHVNCKGGSKCKHDNYFTKATVTMSKPNKTRFEKVLHALGLLPKVKVSSVVQHPQVKGVMHLDPDRAYEQVLNGVVAALEKKHVKK